MFDLDITQAQLPLLMLNDLITLRKLPITCSTLSLQHYQEETDIVTYVPYEAWSPGAIMSSVAVLSSF